MATRPELAALLARASREMHRAEDLDSTLQVAVQALVAALPRTHHVGIALVEPRDGWSTRAASADLVHELDGVQRELGEGPSVHLLGLDGEDGGEDRDPLVLVPDLRGEHRWAAYVSRADALGVTSQAAVRLALGGRTLGGINVYATGPDGLGREDPEDPGSTATLLRLFAMHAALAVDRVTGEENLRAALRTRKTIGQAVGLVMERYGLDEDQAFSYLVRLSSNRNVKLREIAAHLVDEANQNGTPRPAH